MKANEVALNDFLSQTKTASAVSMIIMLFKPIAVVSLLVDLMKEFLVSIAITSPVSELLFKSF